MFYPFLVDMKLQLLSRNSGFCTGFIETGETSASEFPRSGKK